MESPATLMTDPQFDAAMGELILAHDCAKCGKTNKAGIHIRLAMAILRGTDGQEHEDAVQDVR